MVVFPKETTLKTQLVKAVAAEFRDRFGADYKVVDPLSWSQFKVLQESNGLHITLNREPKDPTRQVSVTITGSAIFAEPPRLSGFGVWTKGFVVLLVKIDSPNDLECDAPCHISIGQAVKKTANTNVSSSSKTMLAEPKAHLVDDINDFDEKEFRFKFTNTRSRQSSVDKVDADIERDRKAMKRNVGIAHQSRRAAKQMIDDE